MLAKVATLGQKGICNMDTYHGVITGIFTGMVLRETVERSQWWRNGMASHWG